jgi:GNAT superfamily N-acetyltransferase
MVGFRLAEAEDTEAIGLLINACFGDEPNIPQLQSALEHNQDRATYLAVVEEETVGFVSGFTTISVDGALRWEIDLLGVKPASQGQGIGRQLIDRSLELGRRSGAVFARALIGEQNAASQRAFTACGFIATEPMVLYTWTPTVHDTVISKFNLIKETIPGLITVNTLTYRGVWLEGKLTEKLVQSARQRAFRGEVSMVGTVVPRRDSDLIKTLEKWHFKEVHAYRHWQKRF